MAGPVASDQWILAHFDESWKVSDVKRYILRKVQGKETGTQLYQPPRNRPVSPITFASIRPTPAGGVQAQDTDLDDPDDDEYSVYSNDDVFSATEGLVRPRPGGTLSFDSPQQAQSDLQADPPPQTHRHALMLFSTGQLLEDDFTLAWYQLQDHELLELHPPSTIVRLSRGGMLEYVQPYFECRIKALRAISTDDRSRTDPKGKRKETEPRSPGDRDRDRPGLPRRRKKTKLEWKDRWLVIHQGQLRLFKGRSARLPPLVLAPFLTPAAGPEPRALVHARLP
jgi:hypothetical protein